ncbi:MAG: YfhO family protein [Oscillospiraceae bacterium]|nr:YfhO family protein [Oscillospiraceae bacterium]
MTTSAVKSKKQTGKYCAAAFAVGFAVFLLAALPFTIQNGGIFYFYGDFNAQQIPFTISYAGGFSLPQFDFTAGTGTDYLDAYSFYNLFSPFTLIFRIFPKSAAIGLLPFVIALKFGFCAMNAYLYISRFCRTDGCAAAGAMLYTFSGYCMVTFIYHYLDALVFFPLLLLSLETAVTEKRRGLFGTAVTLCAFTNYYIFGIEAIFLTVYFLTRLTDKSFRISLRDFFCLAAETVLGLAAAGFVLVPAAAYMINSPRLGDTFGSLRDMTVYNTPWRYARILQSIFISPDLMGYTNFFPDFEGTYPAGSRWSAQAMYVPMFGISGMLAFIGANRKSWQTRLVSVCMVFAFIPVLNSIFSMGSSLYYARWMFAPTLIIACMTACALENEPKYFKTGIAVNGAAVLVLTAFTLLFPMEKLSLWKTGAYYSNVQKWAQIVLTAGGLAVSALLVFKAKRDEQFPLKAFAASAALIFAFTESIILFGMGETRYPEAENTYITETPQTESSAYGKRIFTTDDASNKNIIWGIPAAYTFNSIVPPNYAEYCGAVGISSDDIAENHASHCLFSVKEIVTYNHFPGRDDEYFKEDYNIQGIDGDYDFYAADGHYLIFENPNFIPMGFCYDSCISEEDFLALDGETRKNYMLKAIAVEDVSAVSEYLEEADKSEARPLDGNEVAAECAARAERSAHSFSTDGESYTAEITLEKPNLYFSQ